MGKRKKRIVYLIGAGASIAVDPVVPGMDNFLDCALNNLEGPEDASCVLALEKLRELATFPFSGHLETPWPLSGLHDERRLTQFKGFYKTFLSERAQHKKPGYNNLESIFDEATMGWHKDGGEAHRRLTTLIGWLFSKLDQKLSTSLTSSKNPYRILGGWLSEKAASEYQHLLISFNYDVWLEQALFDSHVGGRRLWHPSDGYCMPSHSTLFGGYLGPSDREQSRRQQANHSKGDIGTMVPLEARLFRNIPKRSRIKILKPHGSLSWVRPVEKPYSTPPLLLLDVDEIHTNTLAGNVVHLEKGQELINIKQQTTSPDRYFPLIVPPATVKARSGRVFWEIQKELDSQINSADVVVVIGWSMPDTDIDSRSRMQGIISRRNKQLEKLIVCNFHQPDPFYTKFENLFWPETEPIFWDEGFNRDFVEKCLTCL
ncbi:MAG: hypothetical protein ABIJ96_03570 [Elusimicrobiota bacterium]